MWRTTESVVAAPTSAVMPVPVMLSAPVAVTAAFSVTAPVERETWRLYFDSGGVRALCAFPERRLSFDRASFAADPRIAELRWER